MRYGQANPWSNGEQLEKPLANGDTAILLFNRLNTTIDISLVFEDIGKVCLMVSTRIAIPTLPSWHVQPM